MKALCKTDIKNRKFVDQTGIIRSDLPQVENKQSAMFIATLLCNIVFQAPLLLQSRKSS